MDWAGKGIEISEEDIAKLKSEDCIPIELTKDDDLFILFILLSLGCPFCILAVCGVLFIVEFPLCGWVCTGGLSRFLG